MLSTRIPPTLLDHHNNINMELKTTEEEVEKMVMEYKSLLKTESRLVDLELKGADDNNRNDAPFLLADTLENETIIMNEAQVLSTLESLQVRITTLEPRMNRFRKRLGEKDPVTDVPRYGEKTANRVTAVLETYDALKEACSLAFDENEGIVQDLQTIVTRQQQEAKLELLRKQEEDEKRIQEEKLEAQQQLQEEERRRQQEELARAQQEAELSRRAQEARAARERAEQRALQQEEERRMEQERIDREWMDSIKHGPEGVKEQLRILKEATATESGAYSTAVSALHTLFSQIVAHPEEVNFRRVRKNHPKFHQDIGRHDGGREVLIAAGFRLGAIDDVPCFISMEPNIETQMDEWSEWFDLLKATLEVLEQELINCS